MKREGRQHGMVRTCDVMSVPCNRHLKNRNLDELSSQTTAGPFTKVSSKPTNHSKFTGKCAWPKCRDCHMGPTGKSKDKVKGAHKTRWRSGGFSAVGVSEYSDGKDCDVDGCDYRGDGGFDSDEGL
ncbi:hypothetical protein OROGR_023476 [Orobanche gracilis]